MSGNHWYVTNFIWRTLKLPTHMPIDFKSTVTSNGGYKIWDCERVILHLGPRTEMTADSSVTMMICMRTRARWAQPQVARRMTDLMDNSKNRQNKCPVVGSSEGLPKHTNETLLKQRCNPTICGSRTGDARIFVYLKILHPVHTLHTHAERKKIINYGM
jgi:hypothetical protein